jgi:hypothetical protein
MLFELFGAFSAIGDGTEGRSGLPIGRRRGLAVSKDCAEPILVPMLEVAYLVD